MPLVPGLGLPEDSDENPTDIWNTKENPKSTWLEKSTKDQGDFCSIFEMRKDWSSRC